MLEHDSGLKEHLSSGGYTFKDGVYFVQGANRGAIYDTNSGRVFSVNKSACQILLGKVNNTDYWKRLEEFGLVNQEKIEERSTFAELIKKPSLQFVWFEIVSDDCNESCIHCYADSMPSTYRKITGVDTNNPVAIEALNTRTKENKKITFEKWKELITESYLLGCRRCQFIGGEPMLYRGENSEDVLNLAEHAKNVGFEFIEIFTNGTLLTEEKIKRVKELELNIAISLYSIDEQTHDSITRLPGSFKKTIKTLERLKEAGIPTRVETVLTKLNEQTIKETQDYVESMGFGHHQPDVLRPKGRGDNPAIMPSRKLIVQYGLMTSPNFSTDKETLSKHLSGHSCLSGKIAITDNGDILPCIFSRNTVVGNALTNKLQEIINSQKLKTIWESTKNNVSVCKDCEYRYACFDCRPLAEGINHGKGKYLSAPYPRCTYNPYAGEWAGGVWRIDKNGQPYYNESLKSVIEKVFIKNKNELN